MPRWIDETLHPAFQFRLRADAVLHDSQTEYQHVVIFENAEFGRVMMLDDVVQLTERDEFIYHEMMAHVPLFAHGRAAKVLIIGGGDGGVLREVLKHPAMGHATLCEIDSGVIELAKAYFPDISAGAFEDPRTTIVIGDGTQFVAETAERYDIILVDSTDPIGPAEALFSADFYRDCKRSLTAAGLLVTQNGIPFVQGDEFRQSMEHLRALFADATAYLATTPTYVGGPMAFGWASDDKDLRRVPLEQLQTRFDAAHPATRYYTAQVHEAAFALPKYIRDMIEPGD